MDGPEEKPQAHTKSQNRPRNAPKWVSQQQQGDQHIAPYQPPKQASAQEVERHDKVRKSRIRDRNQSDANDSSLKIKIELDLEVEVELYARVKGDITIGLL